MKTYTVTIQREEEFSVEARTPEEAEAIVVGMVEDGDHGETTSTYVVDSFLADTDETEELDLDPLA